jgi:hypothetical protein
VRGFLSLEYLEWRLAKRNLLLQTTLHTPWSSEGVNGNKLMSNEVFGVTGTL